MPTASTILATIVGFAFGGFCLWHAARQGTRWVCILLAGTLLGLTLEYFDMKFFGTYHYGPFPFMIFGTVPAMIVVSWGGIVYGTMRVSNHLGLKWYLRPIYDGFLALTIDISLDPVAISLGYWVWTIPGEKPWFGVPFSNYYGWFLVVFCYSLTFRVLARLTRLEARPWPWQVAVPLVAFPLSIVPFALLMAGYGLLMKVCPEPLIFSVVMGAYAVALLWALPVVPHDRPLDRSAIAAPFFFHGFELFMLYFSGFLGVKPLYASHPSLVLLVPVVGTLSVICFCWPFLDDFTTRLKGHRRTLLAPPEGTAPENAPAVG